MKSKRVNSLYRPYPSQVIFRLLSVSEIPGSWDVDLVTWIAQVTFSSSTKNIHFMHMVHVHCLWENWAPLEIRPTWAGGVGGSLILYIGNMAVFCETSRKQNVTGPGCSKAG